MSEMPTQAAVFIGASAGAMDALFALLPALPADFPLPLVVVVHIPADKESLLPQLLQARCKLLVHEAQDKEPALPGAVYIAPPDYHLLIEPDGMLSLSSEEPVLFSRPSIDVLFESAAFACGENATGIVLTGANEDGAEGLRAIMRKGGTGIVQTPETASASAMPEAALKACPQALCLTIPAIADYLIRRFPAHGHAH